MLSSSGRRFSEPGLVENPDRVLNFGANYANSWHGDVVPPPLNSPIPIPPSSPVVPPPSLLGQVDHFGRPLFLLPSGGRYRVRLVGPGEFEVEFF